MSARARAVLAVLLGVCAVGAGVAVWDTPHVSGGTMLAFGLAMTALWVVAPLVDADPDVEVRRITLDEACQRTDDARRSR